MEQKEKELIASRLREYCTAQGGQNKAANTLKGVSAATISKILNGDWDTIAEGMWHNVSKQIGSSTEGWSLVSTSVYDELTELLECQCHRSLRSQRPLGHPVRGGLSEGGAHHGGNI